jgi:hypothetical protein
LDEAAYAAYTTREDYEDVADELLAAGGGDRLFALTESWAERDPDGAAQWVKQAEQEATVATAQAGQQAMQAAENAVTSAYAEELADFYAIHPEYATGSVKNQLLAESLKDNPSIGDSPEAFRQGLEAAKEAVEDVSGAALSAANEMDFREQFRDQAFRGFRPPAADHTAAAAARRIEPNSVEELSAEIVARKNGTRSERQAALQERDAHFRRSFSGLADQNNRGVFERGK